MALYEVYPKNSLVVQKVTNGYKVTTKGTKEMQEDNLDGEYVFNSLLVLLDWMSDYYEKDGEEN